MLFQGIPNAAEVAPPVVAPATDIAAAAPIPVTTTPPTLPTLPTQAPTQPTAGLGPNAAPLNLFPQVVHVCSR